MRVLKFGGTSVQSPEMIRQVAEIVRDTLQQEPVAVVCSAMSGVTDQLANVATQASQGNETYTQSLRDIEKRHLACVSELLPVQHQSCVLANVKMLLNELEDVLQGLYLLKELTPKSRDFVMSFGERFSCLIISEYFASIGLLTELADSRKLILTDNQFGNATVQIDVTYRQIAGHFGQVQATQILPGFIAATAAGETTTLGRGGSDYTAALIAAAVNASVLEIWTDVDGMMTADPRKVRHTFTLDQLSYREALELSHFGAKVLYPPSVQPVLAKNIPLKIKNTFNPAAPGTLITHQTSVGGLPIKGISSIDSVALVTLNGSGMVGVSGFAMRLFNALARQKINVILITQASSEHSITVAITPADAPFARQSIEEEFAPELQGGRIDPVIVEMEQSVLAVVGENMRNTPNISGRLFSALGRNGINVRAIAQGSSEHNISLVIRQTDSRKALNVIHEAFFLSDTKTLNIFLIGTGLVGGTLLDQLRGQANYLLENHAVEIRVAGITNRRNMLFDEEGITLTDWKNALEQSPDAADQQEFAVRAREFNLRNSILVDCTASAEIVHLYEGALTHGMSIVTPNKVACSGPYERYRQLKRLATQRGIKFLYETNVGAGLPIIKTLNDLTQSGDKITRIEAILSGTLNYVFNEHKTGVPFSQVVKRAQELGYSEPDPRIDLNGVDVARKILILAREAGAKLELTDVVSENFLPEACREAPTIAAFFDLLPKYDAEFEAQRQRAEAEGKRLRYVATFEGNGNTLTTGLRTVDSRHPFYQVEGNDNMVLFTTERYHERPLIIKGAGAGAAVTAAGVFADIIRIADF